VIIQLYIQDQRVELFKDESVTITDSIQNVKDIDKVFTAFSQSFSIPASKTNNKIFKHYYNFDIVGGFDARKKVAATIELNNLPFRTGKIKLEGVDLKNNKPHTYRITFFGDIVDLKDKLGENKLSNLNLSAYNLDYDPTTIKSKLTTEESSSNHIICPLITHTQRLFFDSVAHTNDDGNLHYHTGSGNNLHGVKYNELKYAIRVNKIIEAIEDTFDLEFSSDFFKNTSIEEFDHLFLWLHRKSGKVENLSGTRITTQIDGWTYDATNGGITMETDALDVYAGYPSSDYTQFELDLNRTNTTPYDIEIQRDGVTVFTDTNIIATNYEVNAIFGDFTAGDGYYEVFITADIAITFASIVWRVEASPATEPPINVDFSTGTYITSASFPFIVAQQMPDMKVLDFLTGLFKTFNLTAYVENDIIVVKPLNEFYTGTDTYDITEFVDVESSKVDVALPYKDIQFKFKDTKSFLANKFGEISNREWGSIRYTQTEDGNNETDLAGALYKVEVPFGHMLYERLTDLDTGSIKNIQWGYSVDKSQNAYLGSPLLFYPVYVNTFGISYVNSVNANNVATGHEQIFSINQPSNSPQRNPALNAMQLNFNRETNEWTSTTEFNETLYSEYYSEYIKSVFNPKQRLTKVKAYLPMRILLNYSLGDRFVIAGNQYKINSVSTNLLTGESNLELINDL